MEVLVDEQLCARTGYCVRIAPELFLLAGGEIAQVRIGALETPTGSTAELAREAEAACPTGAIFVHGG